MERSETDHSSQHDNATAAKFFTSLKPSYARSIVGVNQCVDLDEELPAFPK
jgi:hypothetical protein